MSVGDVKSLVLDVRPVERGRTVVLNSDERRFNWQRQQSDISILDLAPSQHRVLWRFVTVVTVATVV